MRRGRAIGHLKEECQAVGTARKTVLGANVPDDVKRQRGGQAGGVETWGPREEAGFYLSDMVQQEGYEPEKDGAGSSSQAPSGCRRGTDWGWNRSRGTREEEMRRPGGRRG